MRYKVISKFTMGGYPGYVVMDFADIEKPVPAKLSPTLEQWFCGTTIPDLRTAQTICDRMNEMVDRVRAYYQSFVDAGYAQSFDGAD